MKIRSFLPLMISLLVGGQLMAATNDSSDTVSASQAISQHPGQWYIEGGAGGGLYYLGILSSIGSTSFAGMEGFGWKGAIGYRPQHHSFSLEGGFIQNFYQAKLDSDNPYSNDTAEVNTSIDVPYAAFRWDIAMGQHFTFIPKVGLMLPIVPDVSATIDGSKVTDEGGAIVLPFTGFGLGYALNKHLTASVQYEGAVYGLFGAGLLSGDLTYYFGG